MKDLIHILFQKSLMCSHIDTTQSTSLLFGYKYQNSLIALDTLLLTFCVMNIIRGGVADTSRTQDRVATSSCHAYQRRCKLHGNHIEGLLTVCG